MFLTFLFLTLLILAVLATLGLTGLAWMTQLLPASRLLAVCALLLFVPVVLALLYKANRNKRSAKGIQIVGCLLLAVICLAEAAGLRYLGIANSTLNELTGGDTQITVMGVYVREGDAAQNLQDASHYSFATVSSADELPLAQTLLEMERLCGHGFDLRDQASIPDALIALASGQCGALLINTAYPELFDSGQTGVDASGFRCIYTYNVESSIDSMGGESPHSLVQRLFRRADSQSFCLYVSGIDTWGPVSTASRSDVNILGIVNPESRTVLLISTPRDFYVPFPNVDGRRDKLTHAGVFGVDTSMQVLSDFYNTPVEYFLRMNFTGFQTIIDQLGGVDVYSDASFSAGGYYFTEGINHLDGAAALAFARDRSSFGEGDRARGRHQMAVIQGVIQSLSSSQLLVHYADIMAELAGSFQTNLPKELLGDLVQKTLRGQSWTVVSYSVNGSGKMDWCHAVGATAYVMEPFPDTVEYAQNLIRSIRQGKTLTQEQINQDAPQH